MGGAGGSGPRLLVTSTGRSGSRWLARALNAAGVPAGHERCGGPYGWVVRDDLLVESSWLPLTYADEIPDDVEIVHMVRSPLPCIASLSACALTEPGNTYSARAEGLMGPLTGDRIVDAARWWLAANEEGLRIARDWFWVESLTPGRLGDLAASSGVLVDPRSLARALRKTVDPHPEPLHVRRPDPQEACDHLTLHDPDLLVEVSGLQQLLYQRAKASA